jgi:four helix bundle protein
VQHFTRLKVWAKAHELNIAVHSATKTFPSATRYTIVAQLQRCAASIPANIVEGTAASSDRETARFLIIARRSAAETEYFLLMPRDIQLLSSTSYEHLNRLVVEIQRMLNAFIAYLHARPRRPPNVRRLTADG